MNSMTVESDSKEEVLQEIATRLWQARIEAFLEALRHLKGTNRRIMLLTPAGPARVIFLPTLHKFGVFINVVGHPAWFTLEWPIQDLFLPENQEKEINDIAFMRCSWDGRCYERLQ